jgi:DNA repair protein RecO (recombination protein O)
MERILTPAVLARSVDFGDSDRVCTLLTRDRGKVSALARGAKRSRKRFGGALSLFVIGEAALRPSRGGELMLLERFDGVEDLGAAIGGDVVKLAHGSYLLELTRELWPPGQPEPRGYEILLEGLRTLASAPRASASLLRAYELGALGAVGLAPSLDLCPVCGREVVEAARFDPGRGGAICETCSTSGFPLGGEVLETLRRLQRMPIARAVSAELPPGVSRGLRETMLLVVRQTLGKDLRSLEFILKLQARAAADR